VVRLVVSPFLAAAGDETFGVDALDVAAFRDEAFGFDGVGSSPGSSVEADVLTEVSGAPSPASPPDCATTGAASTDGVATEGMETDGGPAGRLAARFLERVTTGGAVVGASADGDEVSSSSMVLLACLRALGAARRRSVRWESHLRHGDGLPTQACGDAPASS